MCKLHFDAALFRIISRSKTIDGSVKPAEPTHLHAPYNYSGSKKMADTYLPQLFLLKTI